MLDGICSVVLWDFLAISLLVLGRYPFLGECGKLDFLSHFPCNIDPRGVVLRGFPMKPHVG